MHSASRPHIAGCPKEADDRNEACTCAELRCTPPEGPTYVLTVIARDALAASNARRAYPVLVFEDLQAIAHLSGNRFANRIACRLLAVDGLTVRLSLKH